MDIGNLTSFLERTPERNIWGLVSSQFVSYIVPISKLTGFTDREHDRWAQLHA